MRSHDGSAARRQQCSSLLVPAAAVGVFLLASFCVQTTRAQTFHYSRGWTNGKRALFPHALAAGAGAAAGPSPAHSGDGGSAVRAGADFGNPAASNTLDDRMIGGSDEQEDSEEFRFIHPQTRRPHEVAEDGAVADPLSGNTARDSWYHHGHAGVHQSQIGPFCVAALTKCQETMNALLHFTGRNRGSESKRAERDAKNLSAGSSELPAPQETKAV